jgi:hypothetical protein
VNAGHERILVVEQLVTEIGDVELPNGVLPRPPRTTPSTRTGMSMPSLTPSVRAV